MKNHTGEIMVEGMASGAGGSSELGTKFKESFVKGAGYATGGAVAGAIITTVLFPLPGSAEVGAALGSVVGGALGTGRPTS